jgi:hypothetical protein
MLTAYYMSHHDVKVRAERVDMVLSKPIVPQLLVQFAEELMDTLSHPSRERSSFQRLHAELRRSYYLPKSEKPHLTLSEDAAFLLPKEIPFLSA